MQIHHYEQPYLQVCIIEFDECKWIRGKPKPAHRFVHRNIVNRKLPRPQTVGLVRGVSSLVDDGPNFKGGVLKFLGTMKLVALCCRCLQNKKQISFNKRIKLSCDLHHIMWEGNFAPYEQTPPPEWQFQIYVEQLCSRQKLGPPHKN